MGMYLVSRCLVSLNKDLANLGVLDDGSEGRLHALSGAEDGNTTDGLLQGKPLELFVGGGQYRLYDVSTERSTRTV